MLTVVCTDRGQHAETILGDLTRPHGLLRANAGGVGYRTEVAASLVIDDVRRPDYRVQIRCPRCRRHIQWRGERATEIMQALESAGVSRLDVSQLPPASC